MDGRGSAHARGRALNLAALSGAHALTGDLDTAARIGQHAVQEISALASHRAYDRLRTLDTVLVPHATTPAVGEVRGQIPRRPWRWPDPTDQVPVAPGTFGTRRTPFHATIGWCVR